MWSPTHVQVTGELRPIQSINQNSIFDLIAFQFFFRFETEKYDGNVRLTDRSIPRQGFACQRQKR